MAGEIGFDEGGVLDALSKPAYTETVEEFTYDRNGNVLTKRTKAGSVSVADVLAVLVVTGVITLTPIFLSRIGESISSEGLHNKEDYQRKYGPFLGGLIWGLWAENK